MTEHILYCPKCGNKLNISKQLINGNVYQCINCHKAFKTGFLDGSYIQILTEQDLHRLLNPPTEEEQRAEARRIYEYEQSYVEFGEKAYANIMTPEYLAEQERKEQLVKERVKEFRQFISNNDLSRTLKEVLGKEDLYE